MPATWIVGLQRYYRYRQAYICPDCETLSYSWDEFVIKHLRHAGSFSIKKKILYWIGHFEDLSPRSSIEEIEPWRIFEEGPEWL